VLLLGNTQGAKIITQDFGGCQALSAKTTQKYFLLGY
jgi:hypothetical protein